jgi:4-azaleucine resistance transporter AzlC
MSFWPGFRSIIPLWAGMIPFGMAYAVLARSAGLSIFETQLMSIIVFAGSSQFSGAGLFLTGASPVTIILTAFIINARHLLYGLSLGQKMKLTWVQKLVGAYFLTDEAFGMTVASGQNNFAFLLGAELSVFVSWNVSTLVGSLISQTIPDPIALGIDFIFPLSFLAMLIPLLKNRLDILIGGVAGIGAFVLSNMLGLNSGLTILVIGVLGSLFGAFSMKEKNI